MNTLTIKPLKDAGFTLVELLVTVAIVGILASLALSSYEEVKSKAYIAKTVQDLRTIETALLATFDHLEYSTIPLEGSFPGGGGGNPTIDSLATVSDGLGLFLPVAPRAKSSTGAQSYRFDNDGDSYNDNGSGCGRGGRGVNIVIYNVPLETLRSLDQMIDKGDGPNCGRLVVVGSDILVYGVLDNSNL